MSVRKPFNVTLIQPPGYLHAQALAEAAAYLHWALWACGHPAALTSNQIGPNAVNVVLGAHLLNDAMLAKIPPDSIVFNSEQLDDPESRNPSHEGYREVLNRCFVWDYSQANLTQVPHERKAAVPFGYCDALRRRDPPREAGRVLLFYGSASPRRRRIVRALEAAGIPVTWLFGAYGGERDAEMLRCWAVLNLHKSEDASTFEPIRCFYPLINGVPVVSEEVADATANGFRSSMYFFATRALVEGVTQLYADGAEFRRVSGAMLAEFRRQSPVAGMATAIEAFERARP